MPTVRGRIISDRLLKLKHYMWIRRYLHCTPILTCIHAPLHSNRGRDTVTDGERKRSRSRSKSKERDGEGTQKRKRKRASRWSDHPPSPRRDELGADETAPVERAVPDEPVVGDIYNGKISSIMQFGCFVQLEGLRLVS